MWTTHPFPTAELVFASTALIFDSPDNMLSIRGFHVKRENDSDMQGEDQTFWKTPCKDPSRALFLAWADRGPGRLCLFGARS